MTKVCVLNAQLHIDRIDLVLIGAPAAAMATQQTSALLATPPGSSGSMPADGGDDDSLLWSGAGGRRWQVLSTEGCTVTFLFTLCPLNFFLPTIIHYALQMLILTFVFFFFCIVPACIYI